jgi:hypothetical protein
VVWRLEQVGLPPEAGLSLDLVLAWQRPAAFDKPWQFTVAEVAPVQIPFGADPGEAAIIKQLHAGFVGLAGHVVTHSSNHFEAVQTKGMPTKPSVPQMLHALAVPFPAVPLGPGAQWEVSWQIAARNGSTTETRTYSLTALEGADRAHVRVRGNNEWKNDPAALNSEFAILGTSYSISGELEVALSDLLPQSGRLEWRLTTKFKQKGNRPLPSPESKVTMTLGEAPK